MTEDYKQKILDWLVGNYNIESGNDVPEFIENNIQATTIIEELRKEFPYGFFQNGYVLCKNNNGELNGNILVYGYYYVSEGSAASKGYLMLLDSTFNLLKIMKTYNSGTLINSFTILNVDEKGYIYGVDTSTNNVKRFCMLNNVSVKNPTTNDYQVVLRQSYNLQGDVAATNVSVRFLKKSETSAQYLLVGNTNTRIPKITLLRINVGSPNEWINYTYNNVLTINEVYAYWDASQELTMAIFGTDSYDLSKLTIATGTTLQKTEIIQDTRTIFFDDRNVSNVRFIEIKTLTENKFYFALLGVTDTGTGNYLAGIQTYLYNNGNITKVFEFTDEEYVYPSQNDIQVRGKLYEVNNTYFIQFYYNLNTSSSAYTKLLKIMVALLEEELSDVKTELSTTTSYSIDAFNTLVINNQFNLYNVNYLSIDYELGDILTTTKLVYNVNNYNGQPYQALNSLLSNSVNLYDSNEEIIFARNLYDRIINNNITTSIVEIPNYSLNNINIQYQKLLSQTNNIIVNNNNLLVKNMYEEVLLDFINTITMQNQNDPDNVITNLNGAIRVNNSISNQLDYSDTKITKYKINYTDETTEINNLSWAQNNDIYTCEISIYNLSSNPITSVELISEDEDTTYLTIDCSILQTNKIYTITQDVHIE